MSFQKTEYMLCLALCFFQGICIGIQINAVRNAEGFTGLYIGFPIVIILAFHILSISAADNGEINAVVFYLFPVNLSVMLADIDSLHYSAGDHFTIAVHKLSVYLFPGIRIVCICTWHADRLSIGISPAVFCRRVRIQGLVFCNRSNFFAFQVFWILKGRGLLCFLHSLNIIFYFCPNIMFCCKCPNRSSQDIPACKTYSKCNSQNFFNIFH